MSTVLITGANRGIGFGLVKTFLSHTDAPKLIIATCRDPSKAKDLTSLAESDPRVKVLTLDVTNISSFEQFGKDVGVAVGDDGLNLLINNAGMLRRRSSFLEATPEDYLDTLKTNLLGPIFLTKALLPLIQQAAQKNRSKPLGLKRAVIANISSLVGSLQDNQSGGLYTYRESKVALNMFSINLSKELKDSGILVLPLHPGWVLTDMGGPSAPVTVEKCCQGLVDLLYSADESHNAKFLNYDGRELPW